MGAIRSLISDLKLYINGTENADLDININKLSDLAIDEVDKTRFTQEYVTNNLSDKFEWIESGTTRHVYRIKTNRYGSDYKNKVIKFASTMNRRTFNRREVQTWNAVKGTDIGSFFCPIRLFDPEYSWLIMDYAEISLDADDAKEIRDIIESRTDEDHLDIHYNNIGIHKRRGKVVIDYSWGADFRIE